MIRGTLHDRLMPNDFVCVAEEEKGETFIKDFQDKYHGEEKSFPFVWANEIAGDSWVGISVSDYNRLFDKQESLSKDEIINVWRVEGTNESMLDNTGKKVSEGLYLGRCMNSDEGDAEYSFRPIIKKEVIDELLGFSMTGIVVINDEVIAEARENNKFDQRCMIMNVKSDMDEEATGYVEKAKKNGVLEEAFCKERISENDKKENLLNRIVVGVVALTILLFNLFVVWLLFVEEIPNLRRKCGLLRTLGMKEKNIAMSVIQEVLMSIITPIVMIFALAGGICSMFIHSYYGTNFDVVEKTKDVHALIIVLGVYVVVEIVFLLICELWVCKNIMEKRDVDGTV